MTTKKTAKKAPVKKTPPAPIETLNAGQRNLLLIWILLTTNNTTVPDGTGPEDAQKIVDSLQALKVLQHIDQPSVLKLVKAALDPANFSSFAQTRLVFQAIAASMAPWPPSTNAVNHPAAAELQSTFFPA
ncbi:hypothetical protein [Granulicella arctica]|uniref:hypothetical protein n=1 Tax=Granulicella arctica TaxID=940613 RepID=UPI0021E00F45|nr:hypothetical protein [Granulicella arctica]